MLIIASRFFRPVANDKTSIANQLGSAHVVHADNGLWIHVRIANDKVNNSHWCGSQSKPVWSPSLHANRKKYIRVEKTSDNSRWKIEQQSRALEKLISVESDFLQIVQTKLSFTFVIMPRQAFQFWRGHSHQSQFFTLARARFYTSNYTHTHNVE